MKKRKQKSVFNALINFLLISGLGYLLYKSLFKKSYKGHSIKGLPNYRSFIYYENEKLIVLKELEKLSPYYQKKANDVVAQARNYKELKGNFIKFFQNDIISGELIKDKVRILFYIINEKEYLLLHIFLKESDETGTKHKEIARKRIYQWIEAQGK